MANSAAQITEILWRQYSAMLNNGTVSEVVITNGIANAIGQQGVDTIAIRYRNTIEAPVSIITDSVQNVIRVKPSHKQTGHLDVIPKNSAPRNGVSKKDKLPRPLNSWIAFRSYYSPIFSSLQQKDISGFLTYLWQAEPCKSKWSIIAKAYSLVRDLKGKDDAPLDAFLKINTPFVGIVKPEDYMSVLGWDVEIDQVGQILLRRTANPDVNTFDNEVLTTNISVEDVIRNTYELGYINGDDGATVSVPGNEAALTMAVTAQPVRVDNASQFEINSSSVIDNDSSTVLGPKGLNTNLQDMDAIKGPNIVRPKSPVGPSDFSLAGKHPFDTEFEPGLNSFTFDPFIGNRFNAFDIGDSYEINDFDMAQWILDA